MLHFEQGYSNTITKKYHLTIDCREIRMQKKTIRTMLTISFFLIFSGAISLACSTENERPKDSLLRQKINIENFDALNQDGLQGPPDGLRSVSYEFCIPANKKYVDEVRKIEPAIAIQKGVSGRIGCSKEQYLCIGHTDQYFQKKLYQLAQFPYVERIQEAFFE